MMTSLKMSSENLEIKLCLWNIFFNALTTFSIKILWGCIFPQIFFKLIRTEIILIEDLEIFKYKYLSSLITSSLLLQRYTNQVLLTFTTVFYFLNFFEVHNFIIVVWNSTFASQQIRFLWIYSHCRTALFWFLKKVFIWCIHFSHGNIIVYESVSITCNLPVKMIKALMHESFFPRKTWFPLGKKLKDKFSIFAGHLDFIFSEWNFLAWNILFLIAN